MFLKIITLTLLSVTIFEELLSTYKKIPKGDDFELFADGKTIWVKEILS